MTQSCRDENGAPRMLVGSLCIGHPPLVLSISRLENRTELIGFERFIWDEEVVWFVLDVGLSAGFAQIWA